MNDELEKRRQDPDVRILNSESSLALSCSLSSFTRLTSEFRVPCSIFIVLRFAFGIFAHPLCSLLLPFPDG